MDTSLVLDFLRELAANNTLEWMHAHKDAYAAARSEFELFTQNLILRLAERDSSLADLEASSLIARLNRDTRFSSDKSPYTPAFRAHVSPFGRLPIPCGYYLSISPGASFLGGGLFAAVFPDATMRVRDAIAKRPEEFGTVIGSGTFTQYFTLEGEKLKRVPREYDESHPYAEYLKYKSFYIEYHLEDALVTDADALLETAAARFADMKPLNDFLNAALEGFKMPERSVRP